MHKNVTVQRDVLLLCVCHCVINIDPGEDSEVLLHHCKFALEHV